MNFKEKKEVKGTPEKEDLKKANKAYTECISRDFLGKFLSGESVKVEEFCISEREKM